MSNSAESRHPLDRVQIALIVLACLRWHRAVRSSSTIPGIASSDRTARCQRILRDPQSIQFELGLVFVDDVLEQRLDEGMAIPRKSLEKTHDGRDFRGVADGEITASRVVQSHRNVAAVKC